MGFPLPQLLQCLTGVGPSILCLLVSPCVSLRLLLSLFITLCLLSLGMSFFVSFPSVSVCLHLPLSACLHLYLSLFLSLYRLYCLFSCLSLCLLFCVYIRPFSSLSFSLLICLYVSLSVSFPVSFLSLCTEQFVGDPGEDGGPGGVFLPAVVGYCCYSNGFVSPCPS